MSTQVRSQRHRLLRKAIFSICGSTEPNASCLADVGRRAAEIAGRAKPWGHRHLYVLLHLDRYDGGEVKYPITDRLLNAFLILAGREATNGKRSVRVYARGVREGAVILGHSRKCAWRKCRVHFVGDAHRKYCCDGCADLAHADQRKRSAKQRREIARRLVSHRRSEKRRR